MGDAARRTSLAEGTLWLVGGRLVGSLATLAMPIVLARVLDPVAFGTYKQLFLIFGTLFGVAQLGMAESLYYFLPREPGAAGRWIANAVVVLAAAGVAALVASIALADPIAGWLNNPALAGLLPLVGVFLAAMLVAAVLEIVMIATERHRLAAVTFAGSDLIRAALIVAPAILTGRVAAVLAGAIAFAGIRLVATLGYLARRFGASWRPAVALLARQWRYTLPFAAAVVIEVAQVSYHQYAVSAWFDPATFAIYAVGCLQIPFVDLLATSTGNMLMVRMGEAARTGEAVIPLWHEATDRLAVMLVPLSVGLMIIGGDFIVTLFSETYAESAPIFVLSAAMMMFPVLAIDAVLRTYAETRFLLALNLGRLAVIAATIGILVGAFGPIGALLSTVLAMATSKVVALWRVGRILGATGATLLPWRGLAEVAGAATLAAVPALLVSARIDAPPAAAVLAGATFAATYALVLGAARPDGARSLLRLIVRGRWRRAARAAGIAPGTGSSS